MIDGGAGDDVLIAGGGPTVIFGGAGNDVIVGGSGGNILVGGDGTDVVVGGTGRDILIGGKGSDVVAGSSGDDILIGGYTTYDANLVIQNQQFFNSNKDAIQKAGYSQTQAIGGGLFAGCCRRNDKRHQRRQPGHVDANVRYAHDHLLWRRSCHL